MSNIIRFGQNKIELVFRQDWSYVRSIWEFMKGLLNVMIRNNHIVQIISLATVELTENAVKYSAESAIGIDPVRVYLHFDRKKRKVMVETENPADPEHIEELSSELSRVCDPERAREIYLEKLQEVAVRTDGKSQLGLIRIVYEGHAVLENEVKGNRVLMRATFDLNSF